METAARKEPGGVAVLYVVSTPIGNLEDLSPRAARILAEVDLVAAEDTRVARKLFTACAIRPRGPIVSYRAPGEEGRVGGIVDALRAGRSVALLSDAGTPGLSDPGWRLVRGCRDAGIPVRVVPGPSAVAAALAVSGLPADRFHFLGFPPRGPGGRRKLFGEVRDLACSIVLFESPRRVARTLEDLLFVLGDREAAVARELTKVHEEVIQGRLGEILAAIDGRDLKGEVTIVVAGRRPGEDGPSSARRSGGATEEEVRSALTPLLREGLGLREASRRVARALGVHPREAYRLGIGLREEGSEE